MSRHICIYYFIPSSQLSGKIGIILIPILQFLKTLKSLLQHHISKASIIWQPAFFILMLLSLIYTLAWLGCTFCYTKWKFQAILEVAIWAKQDILSVQHVMEKSVPVSVLKLACSTPFCNYYHFVFLDYFPFPLHFLTSLIQFILWQRFSTDKRTVVNMARSLFLEAS